MDALLSNHAPVKLSDNILDLSPLPVLMIDLPKYESVNETLKKIASKLSKKQVLISENQEYKNAGTEVWEHTNAVVPTNRVLNIKNDDIKYLKSFILDKVLEMSNIGSKTHKWTINIVDSWIQKYHNGDFLNLHNHLKDVVPDSATKFWSGAYYIDDGNPDPKKPYSGVITFHVNGHNWHVKPRPGLLLMWPSHLLHHVNPYMGDSERIMMSWNIRANPVIEI
jgi:hypothetical protein